MSSVNLVLILLAGGIGTRINRKISKQMIKYNNLTILEVNIINFSKIFKNIQIQIVTNKKDFIKVSEICNKYAVKIVNNILKITAIPIPQNIIFFLCSVGNWEATIPIIIALSPARTKSIKMI